MLLGRLAGGISGESSGVCSGLNVGNESLDWVSVASGGLHNSDHHRMTEVPAVTLCVIRVAITAGDGHIVCCTPEVDTSP